MKTLIFLTLASLLIFSCDTTDVQYSDEIIISKLEKEWVHSYEEETDSVQIYRPADYKDFPKSRFRQSYIFNKNGECAFLVLAANDAHHYDNGIWNYTKENQILTISVPSDQTEKKF